VPIQQGREEGRSVQLAQIAIAKAPVEALQKGDRTAVDGKTEVHAKHESHRYPLVPPRILSRLPLELLPRLAVLSTLRNGNGVYAQLRVAAVLTYWSRRGHRSF
jgi:hypothetical protein